MTSPAWVTKYIGLPYANVGRDGSTGVDCWGLVRLAYKNEKGMDLPLHDKDYIHGYNSEQTSKVIISEEADNWHVVTSPQEFDVVVFNLAGKPSHIGLIVDATTFIHNLEGRNVSIGKLDSFVWKKRIDNFYRHNGVAP